MKFSEVFKIKRTAKDDWFDPLLNLDTRLFIDPFLLFDTKKKSFKGSHDDVIRVFNDAFRLIAKSGGKKSNLSWKRAVSMLIFPEVEELCLGYTLENTKGSGSRLKYAETIADGLWEAIKSGAEELDHFEEISILKEGIGADRISDITANIIRYRLAAYTDEVCARHGVPRTRFKIPRGVYRSDRNRWCDLHVKLPVNPHNSRPILLVPRQYLRDLPTVNADEFWQYCYSNENATLRAELGGDISSSVDKKTIIQIAQAHPDFRSKYLRRTEKAGSKHYNFEEDPKGVVNWYDLASTFGKKNKKKLTFDTIDEFKDFNSELIQTFRNYVENQKGWSFLWNGAKAKPESAVQNLFLGIVSHYCRANDIDISKEPNIGRGPVDFKVSRGATLRALHEVKLAKNSKFWNGLHRQLPKYQEAEQIKVGYFLAVIQSEADLKRTAVLKTTVADLRKSTGYDIHMVVIDARRDPPSASKL